MSIFHLSVQIIGRSNGRSSTAAAAYRAGTRITDERTNEVHDFTRKKGVRESFILAPDNAPAWMNDRTSLWNQVELSEKRRDAQLAREIEIALPYELPHERRRSLVVEFLLDEFVSRGMVADAALHAPGREGDRRNEHAHIMLTLRHIDGEHFGQKAREWNDTTLVEHWRESWARRVNIALQDANQSARIDNRSYARQALAAGHDITLAPIGTIHLGPRASSAERRGVRTAPGDLNRELKIINLGLERARRDSDMIPKKRIVHFHPHGKKESKMCVSIELDPNSLKLEAERYSKERDALLEAAKKHLGTEEAGAARKQWEATTPARHPASPSLMHAQQNLDRVTSILLDAKATQRSKQERASEIKDTVNAIRTVMAWRNRHPYRATLSDWRIWPTTKAQLPSWLLDKDGNELPKNGAFDQIEPHALLEEWDWLVASNSKIKSEILAIQEQLVEAEKIFNAPDLCDERERIEHDYAQKLENHEDLARLLERLELSEHQHSKTLAELDEFRETFQRTELQAPNADDGSESAARAVGPFLADVSQGLDTAGKAFVAMRVWFAAQEAQQEANELSDDCNDTCGTPPAGNGGAVILTFRPSQDSRAHRPKP